MRKPCKGVRPPYKIIKISTQHYVECFLYVRRRFTSCLIQDESYFLEVSRYIHLNPVKAQMVREPLDYKYSSYGLFVDSNQVRKRKTDMMIGELVDTGRILSFFGNDSREHYRSFVEEKISHEDQEMLIQKDMKEDDMWLP